MLNHVLDDLEGFKQLLKDTAAAWTELEKKSKKSRRKKNDGIRQYYNPLYEIVLHALHCSANVPYNSHSCSGSSEEEG